MLGNLPLEKSGIVSKEHICEGECIFQAVYDPHSEYILVCSVLQYPPRVQSTKNSNMYCM